MPSSSSPVPLLIEYDRDTEPAKHPEFRTRATFSKIAILSIIPVAAGIMSYFLVRSELYARRGDPPWIRASSQIYAAQGVNCEIVIYGDSTAITGLDPRVIAQQTGLSTCNIAQTKGAIVVLGTRALDRYLQKNKRPKYLILQFAGADFYHATSWGDTTSYMEGGIALIRYYPGFQFLSMLPRHPELLIGMMRYAFVTAPVNWWRNSRHPVPFENGPETPINVHFTRAEPAYKSCQEVEDLDPIFHKPDITFTNWLKEHYRQYADQLIVDVAPTSMCDPRAAYLRATLTGIDNSLQQYPLSFFNEGWDHYTSAGANHLSLDVVRQIKSVGKAASE